jgi:hypothetical protein
MYAGDAQTLGRNWHTDILNAWTPDNTNTNIPKLDAQRSYDLSGQSTTFGLISSNYLSLNNVTIGYTIPAKLTRKFGIESIRIYGAGENLALWSKRKGLDPRMSIASSSNGTYSTLRNISGGLRVTF